MAKITHKSLNETIDIDRVIGRYTQDKPGPTVIFLCGTHGNETSSIFAIKKVFEELDELQPPINGVLIAAYAGNLEALKQDKRYIDMDLNRMWVPERLKRLGFFDNMDEPSGHEKKEKEELLGLLRENFEKVKGELFVFDLHTTSSVSPPITAISDSIKNRELALQYPLPCVVGFDEQTEGTFMNFINELGITGVAFEGGEHYSLSAIENNISFIWYTLGLIKSISIADIPDYGKHYSVLSKENIGNHKIFDLVYHHKIRKEDQFKMKPNFSTFDKIKLGQPIAEDKNGTIHAQESGRIFMPLYQEQGDDGYFIVQEKSNAWLKLSKNLRKVRAERLLLALPGVKRHPDDKYTLVIKKDIFPTLQKQLRLLGYRRKLVKDDVVITTRRLYEFSSPSIYNLHGTT
ncbi:MAG: succinylglutamate desuccinylase/aspartoacylase family protein [Balneolales bacterium]